MVSSAAGAAGALAGWAIASIGKQLPMSELHTTMSASTGSAVALQASTFPGGISNGQSSSPRSSMSDTKRPARPAAVSSFGAAAPSRLGRGGGMQLGGGTSLSSASRAAESSSLADALAGEFEEDGDEVANAWGQGDLMDVNADADDWSEWGNGSR
jgi:SCY1-like protein 1